MSLPTSDASYLSWLPMEGAIIISLIVLSVILLSSLKIVSTRENLLYHISYAKSHEEHSEAKIMIQELIKLDKEIDAMEDNYADICEVNKKS